jgi:myosin heavy subunit
MLSHQSQPCEPFDSCCRIPKLARRANESMPGGEHMGKVYSSLKETLQRGKANSMAIARVKSSHALTLNDEMDELERLVVDRLGKFKAAVKEGETLVAGELQDVGQVAENLKAQIAALEDKLKETEDSLERKDLASQKMEASLAAEIHRLQTVVKEKEKVLETRDNEVNDLQSKMDVLGTRITEFESAIRQAKAEAASEAERAERVTESFTARITAMEAQLSQTQETVRAKELAIQEQEQNLSAKIQELETQLKNKERLLTERDRQVSDLESQLKVRNEVTSYSSQTEGSTAVRLQDPGAPLKTEPETPGTSQVKGATSNTTGAAPETLSPAFFKRAFHELTDFIGPFAGMIVRDHVKALGESLDKFPKARLIELFELVSKEILNEEMKAAFRKWVAKTCKAVE